MRYMRWEKGSALPLPSICRVILHIYPK
jgi:hypothetical protein